METSQAGPVSPVLTSLRAPRKVRTKGQHLGDLRLAAVFLVAFMNLLYIPVGPQLYPAELLLALLTLAALANRAKTPVGGGLIGLLLFWAIGAVLSDMNSGSEALDAAKGVLRVAFTITNLVGLGWLVRDDPRAVRLFWYGMIGAAVTSFFFYPNTAAPGEPWKFGLGIPVTLLVALTVSRSGVPRFWQTSAFLGMAGLHFVLGFRSLAVICGLTALVLVCRYRPQAAVLFGAKVRVVFVVAAGLIVGYLVTTAYDALALQGTFGTGARIKAEYLSGQYGSLVSGRTELLYSLQSIFSNPLFGVGSYGSPERSATAQAVAVLENWGYTSIGSDLDDRVVTSFHSEIFGAVAENGLLAAPFWVAIGGLLVLTIVRVIRNEHLLAPLIAFLTTLGIWDLLFSPYGADRRIWFAATIVSILATRGPTTEKQIPARKPATRSPRAIGRAR